jgi:type 2 lantibiotic biosynthesis protein LanM
LWQKRAAELDADLFGDRIAAEGRGENDVTRSVDDSGVFHGAAVPLWVGELTWATRAVCGSFDVDVFAELIDREDPVAFQDLFLPIVHAASERIELARLAHQFSPQGIASLQRSLLKRLARVFSRPLYEHFVLYRMTHGVLHTQSDAACPDIEAAPARAIYESFIKALRAGEFDELLDLRPVLARLLVTITVEWMSTTKEFVGRLSKDVDLIRTKLAGGVESGRVVHVEAELSDKHNGRTVLRVSFANGLEVAYKPKALALDVAMANFLDWLSHAGAPQSCGVPSTIDCGEYGWAEWIHSRPCADARDVESFFQHAGAMLCLINVLGGTDFHAENIVAKRSTPFAIDLETLFHPWMPSLEEVATKHTATACAAVSLRESVIASYYLPSWTLRPDDLLVKSGGLNPHSVAGSQYVEFEHTNTDEMRCVSKPRPARTSSNLPKLGDVQFTGADHVRYIKLGFGNMYQFLCRNRTLISDTNGPLNFFLGAKVRAVIRPTALYDLLLEQALRPAALSSGFRWSVNFEYLARSMRWKPRASADWLVQRSERKALSCLDVPYFSTFTDSKDLVLDGAVATAKGYFAARPIDRQRAYIARLSAKRMREQMRYIQWACSEPSGTGDTQIGRALSAAVDPCTNTLDHDGILRICESLARLLRQAAHYRTNAAAWVGAVPITEGESASQLEVVGHGLYSGGTGIALFFGALYSITRCAEYKTLAIAAVADCRSELREVREFAEVVGIGGGSGLGSMIYGFTRLALLLEEPDLLDEAMWVALRVDEGQISQDRHLDVLLGAAGAVFGLLALHSVRPDDRTLSTAVACGVHLIAHQEQMSSGGQSWRTVNGWPLTGMSHGAAGISLALLRLHRETQDARFREAARLGIDYERSVFSAGANNWPDLRPGASARDRFLCQWCYGAAGIGLARLGCLGLLEDEHVVKEIESALLATASYPDSSNDDLCCGNFGRLEFVLVAGDRLRRPELTALAQCMARNVVARSARHGDFQWRSGSGWQNPSFFTGIAGVGYELLRLVARDSLPSILLWE